MMKRLLIYSLLGGAFLAHAAPEAKLARPGKLLLEEHFEAAVIPTNWAPGGRPNSFSIAEGALQGTASPDDSHGPSIAVPVSGKNFTAAFRVRFIKPGYFLFLMDGKTPFNETDHLLRFALTDSIAQIAQDRGTLASKHEQQIARAKTGQKMIAATKEQLADPKFHRTESIAHQPTKIAAAGWHDVLIEQRGHEVRAQVDGEISLSGTGSVIDGEKSRIVFLVGNSGTVQIDDVRVWENDSKP
jgi:hypothetical protein